MITDPHHASGLPRTAAAQRKLACGASHPQQPGRQAGPVIRVLLPGQFSGQADWQQFACAGRSQIAAGARRGGHSPTIRSRDSIAQLATRSCRGFAQSHYSGTSGASGATVPSRPGRTGTHPRAGLPRLSVIGSG